MKKILLYSLLVSLLACTKEYNPAPVNNPSDSIRPPYSVRSPYIKIKNR